MSAVWLTTRSGLGLKCGLVDGVDRFKPDYICFVSQVFISINLPGWRTNLVPDVTILSGFVL